MLGVLAAPLAMLGQGDLVLVRAFVLAGPVVGALALLAVHADKIVLRHIAKC